MIIISFQILILDWDFDSDRGSESAIQILIQILIPIHSDSNCGSNFKVWL